MLKQEYRYGIYYFNREEPQDARLIEEAAPEETEEVW